MRKVWTSYLISSMDATLPPIVFVGGVHGVGKSTFAEAIALRTGRVHLSAGPLIAQHLRKPASTDKAVTDVIANQDALVAALRDLRMTSPVVLDGHFCLISDTGEIRDVPLSTFRLLNPQMAFALQADTSTILERLSKRDGRQYDLAFVAAFQAREIEVGRRISQELNVPFVVSDGRDVESVARQVLSIPL